MLIFCWDFARNVLPQPDGNSWDSILRWHSITLHWIVQVFLSLHAALVPYEIISMCMQFQPAKKCDFIFDNLTFVVPRLRLCKVKSKLPLKVLVCGCACVCVSDWDINYNMLNIQRSPLLTPPVWHYYADKWRNWAAGGWCSKMH